MYKGLQNASEALQAHVVRWAIHYVRRADLACICASCAFLAFVECGGNDLDTFDWSRADYQKIAHRLLFIQIRGPGSDSYNEILHWRNRMGLSGSTYGSGWFSTHTVTLDEIDAQVCVDMLRDKLPEADFCVLEAIGLQGYSIKDYAPIWAHSPHYKGRYHSRQHVENALSKRYRAALKAARLCLTEAA